MPPRRQSQLYIAHSDIFMRQALKGTPLDVADIDASLNITSRNYINFDQTVEEILDCTGEELIDEEVTREVARLPIEMNFDPRTSGGLIALNFGIAASPSGATANEVQTITVDATAGTFKIVLNFDGLTATSRAIAWDATAAVIRAALEGMTNIGRGNVQVTRVGTGVITITFINRLASANIPTFSTDATLLVGGTASATPGTTTQGSQLSHAISRVTGYQTPYTSLIVGFRGSNRPPVLLKDAIVGNFEAAARVGELVTFRAEIIASAEYDHVDGYVAPDCSDIMPTRFSDCRFRLGGVEKYDLLKGFTIGHDLNTLVGDHAYTGRSVHVQRLERADRRTINLRYALGGEEGDDEYVLADARTQIAHQLRVGRIGENVTFDLPTAKIVHDDEEVGFGGEAPESEMNFRALPKRDAAVAGSPISATANVTQADAYLTT